MDGILMQFFWGWLGNTKDCTRTNGLLLFCPDVLAEYTQTNGKVPEWLTFRKVFRKVNSLRCVNWLKYKYETVCSEGEKQVTAAYVEREFESVFHISGTAEKQAATTADRFDTRVIEEIGQSMDEEYQEPDFEASKRKSIQLLEVSLDNIAFLWIAESIMSLIT